MDPLSSPTFHPSRKALEIAMADVVGWTRHRTQPKGSGGSVLQIRIEELIEWEFNWIPPEYGQRPEYARALPRWASDLNETRQLLLKLDKKFPETFINCYDHSLGMALAARGISPSHISKLTIDADIACEAILRAVNAWPIKLSLE